MSATNQLRTFLEKLDEAIDALPYDGNLDPDDVARIEGKLLAAERCARQLLTPRERLLLDAWLDSKQEYSSARRR